MKLYAFHLSGEHETLPKSEALAILEICTSRFREVGFLDQCLLADAEDLDAKALELRLGMTHSVIEVLAVCDASIDALAEAVRDIELTSNLYRIRARGIKHAALKADQIEREVGKWLLKKGYRADLKNPEVDLKALITDEKIIFGLEVASPDRSGFEDRRPHLKPFFHPGVLMPRIARALVNITQARPGDCLLDPFAGTGGILIEACLVGIRCIGVDVQRSLIRGASANISGLNCSLILGDAKRLPFQDASIDAEVLDIPYGRSALIRAESKDELLKKSLAELIRVLKPEKRMAIVADRPIHKYLEDVGFNVIEIHKERVHRSLVRHISICRK